MFKRLTTLIFLISLALFCSFAVTLGDGLPRVMDMRARAEVVNQITLKRLDRLLSRIMRENGFDMWIIICNQDNLDPVFKTMIPYNCSIPITQILVFYDRGTGEEVERLNLSRSNMLGLHKDAWDYRAWDNEKKESQWDCLARTLRERNPGKIGINESKAIWAANQEWAYVLRSDENDVPAAVPVHHPRGSLLPHLADKVPNMTVEDVQEVSRFHLAHLPLHDFQND